MTLPTHGHELILAALRHQRLGAIPWVPFSGVHAGKLAGLDATQTLTSAENLVRAFAAANRAYDPDGQLVVFDLQIEAEILGCKLLWAEKSPPSVATHPLEAEARIPQRLPQAGDGRLPLILDAMRAVKREFGEHTALFGLVTGPFTLASHLRGTEIFMDSYDRPEYLHELLDFCASAAERVAGFYLQAGMDVIAIVDPVVSQVSPKHFRAFLSQPFTRLFSYIRQQGALSSFFVCGDASKNLEAMCETAPDGVAVDENISMTAARAVTEKFNITLEGNIPLTSRMLLGSQADNMKYVIDLLDSLGVQPGKAPSNLIISPGCDMPYDTPAENTVGVMQALREPQSARLMLANYQAVEMDLSAVVLPDYAHLPRPLMEVFTLDSATCPACGYMLNAAQRAAAELAGRVDMVEYKITVPENIARMKKHGIQNLPSLLINGELKFSSLIPPNRELIEALKAAGA